MLLISFWQVLMFLIAFFIIKTSQEWGRTWYNPWKSKIESKLHEESKFWRALKPSPNQSSMQRRESKKESNTEEFRNPLRNFRKTEGNFTTFFPSCEVFARQREISQPLFTLAKFSQARRKFCNSFSTLRNFHNSLSDLQNLHVIFKYFSTDSVRFLPQDILCNYLFSPYNHLKIFLDI